MVKISPHRIPTRRRRIGVALIHYAIRIPHLLLWILTLGFARKRRFPDTVRKVLLFRADGLGDVIMTLPAISVLRDLWPDAELTLLAGSPTNLLLPHLPNVDRAILLDLPWAQRSVEGMDWGEVRRVLREIRHEKFDLIIDFRGDFRNVFLMRRMGASYRIGCGGGGCGYLLDWEIPVGESRHDVDHKLDAARAIGARVETSKVSADTDVRFDLVTRDEDWNSIRESFPDLEPGGFVVLHPGAQWPGRQWTVAGYAGVADRIVRELGLAVVITGAGREKAVSEAVAERMEETPVNLVDKASFSEFLALLSRARLFLGVDSGPMHMAVALKVPVVALFGAGDPSAIGPWGPGSVVVSETSGFDCSPCAQTVCPHEGRSCMDAISIDRVWQAVRQQLRAGIEEP